MEFLVAPALVALSIFLVVVVAAVLARVERDEVRRNLNLPAADRLSQHFRRASQGFEQTQM